jgi:phosphatidylinositol 3-kinase
VDWLDRLAFREIEVINDSAKRSTQALYVMVEFARIVYDTDEYRMIYYEKNGDQLLHTRNNANIVYDADWEVSEWISCCCFILTILDGDG